eukprot:1176219-Prorocentrum_minimum.AAC.7
MALSSFRPWPGMSVMSHLPSTLVHLAPPRPPTTWTNGNSLTGAGISPTGAGNSPTRAGNSLKGAGNSQTRAGNLPTGAGNSLTRAGNLPTRAGNYLALGRGSGGLRSGKERRRSRGGRPCQSVNHSSVSQSVSQSVSRSVNRTVPSAAPPSVFCRLACPPPAAPPNICVSFGCFGSFPAAAFSGWTCADVRGPAWGVRGVRSSKGFTSATNAAWTNRTQDAWVYSHDGPIGHRMRGYILMMDQSAAGCAPWCRTPNATPRCQSTLQTCAPPTAPACEQAHLSCVSQSHGAVACLSHAC